MKKLALHWQILAGLFLGIIYGLLASEYGWQEFTEDWVKPWGDIFMNCLKLIAVPLVLFSLISGVASLSNITKLSRIGFRTAALYISTTVIAISLGLLVVNTIQPWEGVSKDTKERLLAEYKTEAGEKIENAKKAEERGPLQFLKDIVPDNIVSSATSNKNMLSIIFFAMLFGVAMVLVEDKYSDPVKAFFDGGTAIIIKMVYLIMYIAPLGTFALIGAMLAKFGLEIMSLIAAYTGTVILGLAIMIFVVYPLMVKFLGKYPLKKFFSSIGPAQLLAFSTSSSAATLPVTLDSVQKKIGVSKEVSSFVLPLGATINMDGTSCYQAIAAVFIANLMGVELTFIDQLSIILTATLASIGTAAVPGAGIVMLIIVLAQLGVNMEGVAIILGVDRLLDMCRTVVNVTGDASVATIVARKTGQLNVTN